MPKLDVGDVIQATGVPLLATINDGRRWRVVLVDNDKYLHRMVYTFCLYKGNKRVRFPVDSVDRFINNPRCDNSFIVVRRVK
jgi:hypothetical protein